MELWEQVAGMVWGQMRNNLSFTFKGLALFQENRR